MEGAGSGSDGRTEGDRTTILEIAYITLIIFKKLALFFQQPCAGTHTTAGAALNLYPVLQLVQTQRAS